MATENETRQRWTDAIGSQWKEAAELYVNSSDDPVGDGDFNPNAFSLDSYNAISSFARALGRSGVEGADEFVSAVTGEAVA
jgi:hypothetical protein